MFAAVVLFYGIGAPMIGLDEMRKARQLVSLKVEGAIDSDGVRLRWKPVKGAKSYLIQWREKANEWPVVWSLEDDEIQPDPSGFVEYVETSSGGTYRVVAYSDLECGKELATRWRLDYNHHRPHSSLKYMTPAAFAASLSPPPVEAAPLPAAGTAKEQELVKLS